MKTLKHLTFIMLLVFVINIVSYGQVSPESEKFKYNTWSVEPSIGIMKFNGEISQYGYFPVMKGEHNELRLGGSLSLHKQFNPILGLGGKILFGKLAGIKRKFANYDANGIPLEPGSYFEATVYDYSINATISLLDLFFNDFKGTSDVYAIGGVGLMQYRSVLKRLSDDGYIASKGYTSDGTIKSDMVTAMVFPIGIGAKCKFSDNLDLGFETTFRTIYDDKLDCWEIKNSSKDRYIYACINITYNIGNNEKNMRYISIRGKRESEDFIRNENKRKLDSLQGKLNEVNNNLSNVVDKMKADEADDDGDGVPNIKDLEPNTPKGTMVDARGRTIPKAKTVEVVNTVTVVDTVISKSETLFSIYFDFNSSEIKAEHQVKIVEVAKKLKADPTIKLEIVGHTDKTGSAEYNKTLSDKRIQSIVDVLVKSYEIDVNRIIKVPAGKADPLSSTDDSVNRRVDFNILKK